MDIIYEPYSGATGEGRVRLPLRTRGMDVADFGAVKLLLRVHGEGQQSSTGTGAVAMELLRIFGSDAAGAGRVRLPFTVSGAAGALAPTIGVGSVGLSGMTVRGTGTATAYGAGDIKLPLRVFSSDAAGAGRVRLPLTIYGREAAVSRVATLYQLPTVESYGRDAWMADESLDMGVAGDMDWVMVRRALLAMGVQGGSLLDSLDAVSEDLSFSDVAGVVWNLIASQVLELGETLALDTRILMEVAEALALSAGGGSMLDALHVVIGALQLGDAAAYTWPTEVLETLALAGTGVDGLLALHQQTELLGLSGTAIGYASFSLLAPEALALSVVADTTAELLNQITEGLEFLVRITLPDGVYFAWVCHTEHRAFTSYRNFPFNSFCELDGHYYGATDTGIYLLEGEDDAGTLIDARIRGGLTDLGTGKMKRQEAMYVGYRADGKLLLKVVTTSETGAKAEAWYSLAAQPAEAMREGRIKIGRGLKSVFWGFEIANIDGAEFELDSISWLPMVLDRRI